MKGTCAICIKRKGDPKKAISMLSNHMHKAHYFNPYFDPTGKTTKEDDVLRMAIDVSKNVFWWNNIYY